MKKKAMPPMAMTAGQCGRILFNFTLPEGTAMPELVGALIVHGQRVDMVRESEDRLLLPVCPPGVYLAEVRAAGVCVLYGHVEVLPSPLYEQDGVVCYTIDVDAMTDVLAVSLSMVEGIPGPRGAQGIQGERGLQGASAYDLAVAAGYEGSEAEWVAELQGAQAAVSEAKARAEDASSAARAADEAREAAAADKAAAERARQDAQAAQSKAEQEAAKAEQNAALLGDAALKSGVNVFTGEFCVESNSALMAVVDLTGWDDTDGFCYKTGWAWWAETLCIRVSTTKREIYRWFTRMKNLFGVSECIKKIIILNEGNTFLTWSFSSCKVATPNARILIQRAPHAVKTAYDNWNLLSLDCDVIDYYVPNTYVNLSHLPPSPSLAVVIRVVARVIGTNDNFSIRHITGNKVRCFSASEQRTAVGLFESKDAALECVVVNEGFWEHVTDARRGFYNAKNLLSETMYPAALPSLQTAGEMFHNCELSKGYVLSLLPTLPTWETDGTHLLKLGIHIDHEHDEELLAAISAVAGRGWEVDVQWNGTPTAQTSGTFAMGTLIYAKVGEMELPDGAIERYLSWGHYVTNWEARGYEQFRSLESAYRYFGLPEDD